MVQQASENNPDLRASTDSIRQSARWMATSFGAIGGVLVAGISLGNVEFTELSGLRLAGAIAALLVAVTGIASAIRAASHVLASQFSTLAQVNQVRVAHFLGESLPRRQLPIRESLYQDVVGAIDFHQETLVLVAVNDIGSLEEELKWTAQARLQLHSQQSYRDPRGRRWVPDHLDELQELRSLLDASAANVVQFANDMATRLTFHSFKMTALAAGIAILVGITAFAWVTDTANTPLPTDPIIVDIYLDDDGDAALKTRLGPSCVAGPIEATVIEGPLTSPTVALHPAAGCQPAILEFEEGWGVAIPRE